METEIKKNVYLKDKIAKILFTSKETREFTEAVISKVLEIPMEMVKDNIELLSPNVNSNINTQYSEVDALYENNTSIINIEINYVNYKSMDIKNMKYVCHLMLNQMKKNKGYQKLKPIYQICINNFDVFNKKEFIYKSSLMEEQYHEKRNDFISIIDINIDFLKNIDYTKIIKEDCLEKLLYIFVCNDKDKLNKLYVGDDIMKKVVEKVSSLTENFADELYYDRQEIINNYSYDLGKEERNIEIAKILINDNMSIDKIIQYTGLSKVEIEKITNENE